MCDNIYLCQYVNHTILADLQYVGRLGTDQYVSVSQYDGPDPGVVSD